MNEFEKENFVVSKSDWSLHRKGMLDKERHDRKIKEAIQENLHELINEEEIIVSNGREKIKIPVKSLDQYRFQYNFGKNEQVGQGEGNGQSKQGQKVNGDDNGTKPGDAAGEDLYEAYVDIEQIKEAVFQELELPNLEEKKKSAHLTEKSIEFTDIRKKGIMGNIDKKRTILESMKRNIRQNTGNIQHIIEEDLRFKTWQEKEKPITNAVILAMMDTSGSMGKFEKMIARTFFFWTVQFLKSKYEQIEIRYLAHHTTASEVTEEQFFTKTESGGTICSSVYFKALEVIEKDYPNDEYNIYAFHVSDGDNIKMDNPKCIEAIRRLLEKTNLFGYTEVNEHTRQTTLMADYRKLKSDKFRLHMIRNKKEILPALKTFFSRKEESTWNKN